MQTNDDTLYIMFGEGGQQGHADGRLRTHQAGQDAAERAT
jgi:hypothetical protein